MANFQGSTGLAADWAASTRVPALFEFCYATDTKVLKFGDGTNTWANLPQYGGGSVLIATKELFPSDGTYKSISSGTTAAIGSISFTVPASGRVQVRILAGIFATNGNNGANYYVNLCLGSSSGGTQYGIIRTLGFEDYNYSNTPVQIQADGLITGLNPGATATVYLTFVTGSSQASGYGTVELEVYSA